MKNRKASFSNLSQDVQGYQEEVWRTWTLCWQWL